MSPEMVIALYDEHAPRLYALALRILGDEQAAAEVLEEVFTAPSVPGDFRGLVLAVREKSLARPNRPTVPPVVGAGVVPDAGLLVEQAFFHGRSVTDLARDFAMDEQSVRVMLRDGLRKR